MDDTDLHLIPEKVNCKFLLMCCVHVENTIDIFDFAGKILTFSVYAH